MNILSSFKAQQPLGTFNMHDINNGIDIVNRLSNRLDVICLQETRLRPGDIVPFVHLSNFDKFMYSAMQDDVHMVRRSFGVRKNFD